MSANDALPRVSERAAGDANMVETFARTIDSVGDPRGTRARFGRAEAIVAGVDVAFFNIVFALDASVRPDDVLAAVQLMRERSVPFVAFVGDAVGAPVRSSLLAAGLVASAAPIPSMALHPIPVAIPTAPDGVAVRVGGAELLGAWHEALEADDVLRAVFGPRFVDGPNVRLAVGYLDGAPVSGAAAVLAGGAVGIYSLWTQEAARRRGFGSAVTWAAIADGVQLWGVQTAVLQSTPSGEPLYRSMGFETVANYTVFTQSDAPTVP